MPTQAFLALPGCLSGKEFACQCRRCKRCWFDLWLGKIPWKRKCPITSWQIDGKIVETVADFILGGSKITADGDCNHEIKRHLILERKSYNKSRHTKGHCHPRASSAKTRGFHTHDLEASSSSASFVWENYVLSIIFTLSRCLLPSSMGHALETNRGCEEQAICPETAG